LPAWTHVSVVNLCVPVGFIPIELLKKLASIELWLIICGSPAYHVIVQIWLQLVHVSQVKSQHHFVVKKSGPDQQKW